MDNILDMDWVLSHETKLNKKDAVLFQKCISMEKFHLCSYMLHENNIPFQLEVPKIENPGRFDPFQEIHINEKDLKFANELLNQLLDEDINYPKKINPNLPVESLREMWRKNNNENPYQEKLLRIEFKRRGVQIEERIIAGPISVLIVILVLFLLIMLFSLLGNL